MTQDVTQSAKSRSIQNSLLPLCQEKHLCSLIYYHARIQHKGSGTRSLSGSVGCRLPRRVLLHRFLHGANAQVHQIFISN